MSSASRPPRASYLPPSIATLAARGLRSEAPPANTRPSSEPLQLTTVFEFPTIEDSLAGFERGEGYVYARMGMPNARSLELTVAALEGADDALATSSGMAAILCSVLACTKPGDRVLCQRDVYGGTRALLEQDLPRFGLQVSFIDAYDPAKVGDAFTRGAALLLVESVSNPLLREVDLGALAWHCRSAGVRLLVDNTFATPVFRRPVQQDADLVVHSATKFLGGHHDLCAGVLCGSEVLVAEARGVAQRMGALASPFEAWLAMRGIKTLDVRLKRCDANARVLAERLRAHPAVKKLHYPGWGAMLSFDVGTLAVAEAVVQRAQSIPLTPSLGGTETAFSHSATSSHRALSAAERAELGIGDGLLRLSVGLEEVEDLWRELLRALPNQ